MIQTRPTTRIDYSRRVARVMAYINDHLDEDLPLERLAEIACFSPCHFHRIYRLIAGETASDTVRRLRLHRAANELARSGKPIERIARRAGYGSIEAFTRAFGADHGQPPAAYRSRLTPFHPQPNGDTIMQPVTIKSFEGARLAALEHRGDYQQIGKRFDALAAWAGGHGLLDQPRRWFGIYYDDPESVPKERLHSEAALEIDADTPLGEGMQRRELPPMRVASIIHKGPYAELERTYRILYGEWLPASGEEAADQPCFEHYVNDARTTPPSELLTEIMLPLKD
ncbi:MAG: AraC family transcriptional regulator [Microvirga sp.]|nr:AraC family transcriptional regulator [Microvirga sp.]